MITNPALQAIAYWLIIATEAVMSMLCLGGAWRLFCARGNGAAFVAAKPMAACGLVIVFLLYYVGFVVIGGEWFSMWQSATWNGQSKAVMFLSCAAMVLIVLLIREEDDVAS